MRAIGCVYLLLLLFIVCSCDRPTEATGHILLAEQYAEDAPEKAQAELDSVSPHFYDLSLQWRARYTYAACRVADKLETTLPSFDDIREAKEWYMKKGTAKEKVKSRLFLGRAYRVEKKDTEAMTEYLDALTLAKTAELYNEAGYISSYMGDLYREKNDVQAALAKYKDGADYFYQAGNLRSFGYANRDISKMLIYSDSSQVALDYMWRADSIASVLGDNEMKSYISNGLGNLYESLGDYDKAEQCLLMAIQSDSSNDLSDITALSALYISLKEFDKLHAMLDTIYSPDLPEEYRQGFLYNYYLIYKEKNSLSKSLDYLEQFYKIFKSRLIRTTDANYIEIEKKYNHAKLNSRLQQLTISRQRYSIAVIVSVLVLLAVFIFYQNRRIRSNRKLYEQEKVIAELNSNILDLSLRLDREALLVQSLKELQKNYQDKENEVQSLKKELQEVRVKKMEHSTLRKTLIHGSQVYKPEERIQVDDTLWKALEKEVLAIYPKFTQKLVSKHPRLSQDDLRYCWLSLMKLNASEESTLLNVQPETLRKKRTRIRENMGLESFGGSDLYNYLINEVING